MKCFDRLVLSHIKATLPTSLDPHQFTYRPNRSREAAISLALYTVLTHLEKPDSYVRMLFIVIHSINITTSKLHHLGLSSSLCNWILNFLLERPQAVSSTKPLRTRTPQRNVLDLILSSLFIHDCVRQLTVKFSDDTTVTELISKNDETAHRVEV